MSLASKKGSVLGQAHHGACQFHWVVLSFVKALKGSERKQLVI